MRISDWSSDVCSSDLSHAARSDADPAASAAFFRGLQATSVPVPDASAVALINRLLAARLFDEAWAYYAAARHGSDQRQSRDPAFTSAIEARSAFDWTAVNGSGVSTAILPEAGNGLFRSEEHTSELQSLMRNSSASLCL